VATRPQKRVKFGEFFLEKVGIFARNLKQCRQLAILRPKNKDW